jgi:hypothetical protein
VPAAVTGRWEGTTEVMSPRFPATRVLVIQNLRQETVGADATKWKMRLAFDADVAAGARRQIVTFRTAHEMIKPPPSQ